MKPKVAARTQAGRRQRYSRASTTTPFAGRVSEADAVNPSSGPPQACTLPPLPTAAGFVRRRHFVRPGARNSTDPTGLQYVGDDRLTVILGLWHGPPAPPHKVHNQDEQKDNQEHVE
jgi:hypothetical protein